ncbi:hypothetical protein Ocin01_12584 [Orchesella cincta]|uniref:Uncharacterized protein n=1 Tax=Orchesella cincta TaxID=48709 RepID=A0A1D2MMP4_ORCCI|nr:hypothetical protein Ocin01_12584 [Orchesella cincta]
MCHVTRNTTISTPASVEATPVIGSIIRGSKSNATRVSPFRRIAKTARVNLNKYWGILSSKNQPKSGLSTKGPAVMEFDHSAEMEQNHINEMLEALANAEEQNSINSQIESETSPEPPRRMFVRQCALLSTSYSSCNSFSSYGSHHSSMDFQAGNSSSSQDSLYF